MVFYHVSCPRELPYCSKADIRGGVLEPLVVEPISLVQIVGTSFDVGDQLEMGRLEC